MGSALIRELLEGLIDQTFEEELLKGFREETAPRLFKESKVSYGFAARLVGISRLDFLRLLQKRGVPFVEYTLEDFIATWQSVHSNSTLRTAQALLPPQPGQWNPAGQREAPDAVRRSPNRQITQSSLASAPP